MCSKEAKQCSPGLLIKLIATTTTGYIERVFVVVVAEKKIERKTEGC